MPVAHGGSADGNTDASTEAVRMGASTPPQPPPTTTTPSGRAPGAGPDTRGPGRPGLSPAGPAEPSAHCEQGPRAVGPEGENNTRGKRKPSRDCSGTPSEKEKNVLLYFEKCFQRGYT